MTVIAASATAALVFGPPMAATAAFGVACAQGAAAVGVATGGGSLVGIIGSGAIGAVADGAITGAIGAASAAAASAGGFTGVATASFFAGPIGLAVLGADGVTWDCLEAGCDGEFGHTISWSHPSRPLQPSERPADNRQRRNLRRGERQWRTVPSCTTTSSGGWSSRLPRKLRSSRI